MPMDGQRRTRLDGVRSASAGTDLPMSSANYNSSSTGEMPAVAHLEGRLKGDGNHNLK